LTDNLDVKDGEYDNGQKCPIYCDFCDWLGSWRTCILVADEVHKKVVNKLEGCEHEITFDKKIGDYVCSKCGEKRTPN